MKSGIVVAAALFVAAIFTPHEANASDQVDAEFLAKVWERNSVAVESLQVTWLLYASLSDYQSTPGNEPTKDAAPIVPSANSGPFLLYVYNKVGSKVETEGWLFEKNAMVHQDQYSEGGPRPHLPFVVCDYPTQQLYDKLKRGDATVSSVQESSGTNPMISVTALWSSVDGKPPSARITALLDPALGYAPVECKVNFLFPGGERLVEVHRWTKHVQVLKDLWLPLEHENDGISAGGKVRLRNKDVVLSINVNCNKVVAHERKR